MTLLQIDKRAVSAEEGQALIDRSLTMLDPLGVPILYFSSQDMSRIQELGANKIYTIETEILGTKLKPLMNFLEHQGKSPIERMLISAGFQNEFAQVVSEEIRGENVQHNIAIPLCNVGFDKTAEQYSRGTYIPPIGGMIFRAGEKSEMSFFDDGDISRLNGADRFQHIWHEYAHGTGAGEPQSDLMSAIITRQSFAPSAGHIPLIY